MKLWKQACCLLLCICVFCAAGSAVFAADQAGISAFFDQYSDLFDDTLDFTGDFSDFQFTHLNDQLRLKLKSMDFSSLGEDLKAFLQNSAELSDKELAQAISDLAADHGIPLTESQIQQLCDLSRALEKLSSNELDEKLNKLKEAVDEVEQDRQKVSGFFQSIRDAVSKAVTVIRNFFSRIKVKR